MVFDIATAAVGMGGGLLAYAGATVIGKFFMRDEIDAKDLQKTVNKLERTVDDQGKTIAELKEANKKQDEEIKKLDGYRRYGNNSAKSGQ